MLCLLQIYICSIYVLSGLAGRILETILFFSTELPSWFPTENLHLMFRVWLYIVFTQCYLSVKCHQLREEGSVIVSWMFPFCFKIICFPCSMCTLLLRLQVYCRINLFPGEEKVEVFWFVLILKYADCKKINIMVFFFLLLPLFTLIPYCFLN